MSGDPIEEPKQPGEGAADYAVGYCKPPTQHRFPKGRSGNPRGRPPKKRQEHAAQHMGGVSSLSEVQRLWLEEARTPIPVSVNGKVEHVSAVRAVVMSLRKQALSGNPRAQDLYLKNAAAAQAAAAAIDLEAFEALLHYKLVFEQEVRHRNIIGKPIDDILPHPADIIVNPRSGFHKIIGPLDQHERRRYDQLVGALVTLQERISEAAAVYQRTKSRKKGEALKRWHEYQSFYDRINDQLPPSLQRELADRSLDSGATKPGDFFNWSPDDVEALVGEMNSARKRRRRP